MRLPVILLLGLLASPRSAVAQRIAPPAFPSLDTPSAEAPGLANRQLVPRSDDEYSSTSTLGFGGLLGAVGGFWAGGYLGSQFRSSPCEDCGLEGARYGAARGVGLGASTGVHLANHRRGSFGKSALVTLAIGVAGTVAAVEADRWEILLAIPIAQVASAVAIERDGER